MTIEDTYTTLQQQGMISVRDAPSQARPLPGQSIKFPKGRKNGIARKHLQRTTTQDEEKFKGPFVPPRNYTIRWNPETVEHYLSKWEAKGYLKLKPENLKWSPFLIARARKSDTLQTEVELLDTPVDGEEEAETPRSRSRTGNSSVTDEHGANPPKSGSSSSLSHRAHHRFRETDSPAAALFDDDVQVINSFTPQSSFSRNELPAIPTVVSSPEAASRPGSPEDVRRSLRRNTQAQVTSLRRSSRQSTTTTTLPMSQASPPQTPNQYQRRPVGGMRRNRSSGIRGVGGGGGPPPTPSPIATPNAQNNSNPNIPEAPYDSLMAEDAALAAKLAMEEGSLPRRQLRSRSNTEQDGKLFTMPLPPLRRLSSSYSTTKKRKRVESPSPMDVGGSEGKRGRDTVPPTPTPASRNTQGPRRSSFRVDKSARMDFAVLPSVVSPVDEKEGFDVGVNGTGRSKTKSKSRAKGKSGGNRKAKGRGRGITPTTPVLDSQVTPLNGIEEEEQQERSETVQENTERPVVSVVPEHSQESSAPQPSVKCEDAGTPVMGVTPGRQSAPSDATVCVVEDLSGGVLKGSPEEGRLHDDVEMRGPTVVNGAEEQEEDERVVMAEEEEEEGDDEGTLQRGAPPAISKPMFICEEGDADAEGEIDEGIEVDAEGEIVDIDADGEIDDDVDAEGELDVEGEGYEVDVDAEGEIDLEETI